MRRIASAMAAVLVTASGIIGITLTSAMPASAQASCTGSTAFLVNVNPRVTVNIPTVGNQTGNDNCELGLGNNNPAVGVLQHNLNRCHGENLAVDDNYGPLTKEAVEDVQAAAHITVDGIYGPQTRDHISWIDSAGKCIAF